MISHVKRIVAGGAGSRNLLSASSESGDVADRQGLRVEELFAARNGSLLRILGVQEGRVDRKYVGSELLSLRIGTQRVVDSRIVRLGRQELSSSLGLFREISGGEVKQLRRVESEFEVHDVAQLRTGRRLPGLGMDQGCVNCLLGQVRIQIGGEGLPVIQRQRERFPAIEHDCTQET